MKRAIVSICVLCLAGAPPIFSATAPETFAAANRAFQSQDWKGVRERVGELFELASELPIAERAKLVPPALFLRAAAAAMLNDDEAARSDFRLYLLWTPGAALDSAKFPKKIVKGLEKAREDYGDVAREYSDFKALPETSALSAATLVAGPLRLALGEDDLATIAAAPDPAAAEAALGEILGRLGGDAAAVDEILDRYAFAELAFASGGLPGSATDRATALVLIGPPTQTRQPVLKDNEGVGAHVGDNREMGGALRSDGVEVWVYRGQQAPPWYSSKSVELTFEIDRERGTWTLEKRFPAPIIVEGGAKSLRETGHV